ncbi:MAG: transposase [SAR324 cluster bacterium]|nr:transposase [SAR324 cluster bacterium]
MAFTLQPFLFKWEEVDARSDLDRLRLVLEALPDEALVRKLETARRRGRDDYPVRACWNALIAGVVYQHPSAAALLRELRRNGELRAACGFNPLLGVTAAPPEWAFSRFLKNLVGQEQEVRRMFETLVERVAQELPDFGRHLAVDGKAIPSHATGRKNRKTGVTSDPDAAWGVKTSLGEKDGKPYEKVSKWFGYTLHLAVDATHELPLAYEVTPANASETTMLLPLVEQIAGQTPTVHERIETAAADRGYDSAEIHSALWKEHGIKGVIDNRALWKVEKKEPGYDPQQEITRPLFPGRADVVVYSEKGVVSCQCPVTGARREMAFSGFEQDRDSLKYRCPAAAYDLECAGRTECAKAAGVQPGSYGRIVRIPLERDRRIFTPLARSSYAWKTQYAKRTAVERVNSRIDQVYGFEAHFIRGKAKMTLRVGLALTVMLAVALGHLKEKRAGHIRSLVRAYRPPERRAG